MLRILFIVFCFNELTVYFSRPSAIRDQRVELTTSSGIISTNQLQTSDVTFPPEFAMQPGYRRQTVIRIHQYVDETVQHRAEISYRSIRRLVVVMRLREPRPNTLFTIKCNDLILNILNFEKKILYTFIVLLQVAI